MTDLLLVLSFIGFLAIGVLSPFVLGLGYVWVDMFSPNRISDSLLQTVPVALIMAVAAIGAYVAMDRNAPPRPSPLILMMVLLAGWITLTTSWAAAPVQAEMKWDPSFKTILFAVFLPFIFRTRIQIEAFLLVMIFASSVHIIPWGLKVIVSGGGYGRSLGQLGSNQFFLSESSAVAATCFTFVPLLLLYARGTVLLPRRRWVALGFYAMAGLYGLGAVGTFARVALVGAAVAFAGLWIQAKRKTWFTVAAVVTVLVMGAFTTNQWADRIATTAEFQTENSAATRVAVWKWAWAYAQDNPLGGGFNCFVFNRIETQTLDPLNPTVQFGRAFHNIYFATLAEHGYPGLLIYGSILALALYTFGRTRRLLKDHPEHGWASDLAAAGRLALLVFMACANFIDVSYNPMLWNLIGLALCLQEYTRRALASVPVRVGQTEDEFMRRRPLLPASPAPVPAASKIAARLT